MNFLKTRWDIGRLGCCGTIPLTWLTVLSLPLTGAFMNRPNPNFLRPAPGGRQAVKAPQPGSFAWALVIAIALLLLVIGLSVLHPWTRSTADVPPASQAAAAPDSIAVDPVSEHRIIFGGLPRARRTDIQFTILRNTAYIVGYCEQRKDPLWSAYRVTRNAGDFHLARPKGNFLTDTRTLAQVTHHDFTGSGYDRGHMTPNRAIATDYGPEAQLETFLLSNICPQAPALNQQVWERLETNELEYANRFSDVWITDGPIFADLNGGPVKTLRSGIHIPQAFYKILVENHAGKPRAFAVIMPQTVKGTERPDQFVASIHEIEEKTQLEFFPTLDDKTRHALKDQPSLMW